MKKERLVTFLHSEEIRFTASRIALALGDNRNVKNLSDFDVYDLLCANLYLLLGNRKREEFLNVLEGELGEHIDVDRLFDRAYSIYVWQRIFNIESNTMHICDLKKNIQNAYGIEGLSEVCLAINSEYSDIYELLQSNVERINILGANVIDFNAVNIEFSRPNDFLASKNYDAIKRGEQDSSVLSLWLLCRILMNCNVALRLTVDSVEKAEKILSLIFKLRLSPKVILCIDGNVNYADAFLLLLGYQEKNISLVLLTKEKNDLMDALNEIPICFISSIGQGKKMLDEIYPKSYNNEKSRIFSFLNLVE